MVCSVGYCSGTSIPLPLLFISAYRRDGRLPWLQLSMAISLFYGH